MNPAYGTARPCKHCGAMIHQLLSVNVVEKINFPGVGDLDCWRLAAGGAGQAWCSKHAGDGPPHQPAEWDAPASLNPEEVRTWLNKV